MLSTERLQLSPFALDDLDLLIELHRDAEVMRFLSADGVQWSRDSLQRRLQRFVAEQNELGFSKWRVHRKSDGAFVGRAGFSPYPETGEIELGFSFKRGSWNRGYSTECGKALLPWLFQNNDGLDHVIAFAHVDNVASRRVLEKLGMRSTGTRPANGLLSAFYIINRTEVASCAR